jgi:hypothetical protein
VRLLETIRVGDAEYHAAQQELATLLRSRGELQL